MTDKISASEALFAFCSWLTSREEKTVMSSKDDAAGIADLIGEFCKKNKLNPPSENWDKNVKNMSEN